MPVQDVLPGLPINWEPLPVMDYPIELGGSLCQVARDRLLWDTKLEGAAHGCLPTISARESAGGDGVVRAPHLWP
eukprot:97125-Alexandrium_andersonii.AAC.1